MSFREKSAWISFVTILLFFGVLFWNVARVLAGRVTARAIYPLSMRLITGFVILEIVLHLVVAVRAPNEALASRDERERLIDMRATRLAFPVLVVGALAGVGMLHVTTNAWAMAHVVLLAVVVAELLRFGSQVLFYSRGV